MWSLAPANHIVLLMWSLAPANYIVLREPRLAHQSQHRKISLIDTNFENIAAIDPYRTPSENWLFTDEGVGGV